MSDTDADWLSPTHDIGIYPFPAPRAGLDYQLLIGLWAYRQQVERLRWYLAHPELPVPGFGPLPTPSMPQGHKKSARHARQRIAAEHLGQVRSEHVRRLVLVFWTRLELIASWIEARSEHGQARTVDHVHPA